jgi:hypothetical protein
MLNIVNDQEGYTLFNTFVTDFLNLLTAIIQDEPDPGAMGRIPLYC